MQTQTQVRENLEQKARANYYALLHKVVEVKRLSGFVGHDSYEFFCSGTTVRIDVTEVHTVCRWMDEDVLDPVYEVEIVEPGELTEAFGKLPLGTVPRSCWIYGTSLYLDGKEEPGDIV